MALSSSRIGLVSVWFERGQAHVTRTIRDALSTNHETFVFARTGEVFGTPQLETTGEWQVPNLTVYPEYRIPPDLLADWIRSCRLDMVIFNEEYDWDLVRAAKRTGAKIATYLDFYAEDWRDLLSLYDRVLCSTRRTYDQVREFCAAAFIGWGVDLERFRPRPARSSRRTFFHNAGWLGNQYRKMTPIVLAAFDAISRHLPDVTLFVHAQADRSILPAESLRVLERNPRIEYFVGTVPAPGLYSEGTIHVLPTKLEGLGLPIVEGLACGMPTIVTDAPPMNEFVRDKWNGLLVKVAHQAPRSDAIAFPETFVDGLDLALKMAGLALEQELTMEMGRNARASAVELFDPARFRARLEAALFEPNERPAGERMA